MVRVLGILLFVVTLSFAGVKKIVFDLTSGDMETFGARFLGGVPGTIQYWKHSGDEVEAVVVIHGDAYKFFIANLDHTRYALDEKLVARHDEIRRKLDEIRSRHPIRFEICQTGMGRKGILSEDIYPYVTPIKSAMIGLSGWQNEGYAYIPIP